MAVLGVRLAHVLYLLSPFRALDSDEICVEGLFYTHETMSDNTVYRMAYCSRQNQVYNAACIDKIITMRHIRTFVPQSKGSREGVNLVKNH